MSGGPEGAAGGVGDEEVVAADVEDVGDFDEDVEAGGDAAVFGLFTPAVGAR